MHKIITSGTSKTCALDPLPTSTVKQFLPERLPYVTAMCNSSLQHCCLPQSQRRAIVTPRLKKQNADPADVKNYRPISHLTFMSKVVERLVCRQLVAYLNRHNFFCCTSVSLQTISLDRNQRLATSITFCLIVCPNRSAFEVRYWNSLPLPLRDSTLTLRQFGRWLRTHLFSLAYGCASWLLRL